MYPICFSAVDIQLLSTLFNYYTLSQVNETVGKAGNSLVHGHIITRGVAIAVNNIPPLCHHPTVSLDDADDGSGSRCIVIRVPAEVERGSKGFDEVSFTVKQGGNSGSCIELVPVSIAHGAAMAAVVLFDKTTGGTPIVRI